MKIQVIIAKKAGACAGVKRALKLAYDCAKTPGYASTLEPLIHNPNVVAELQEKGVALANSIKDVNTQAVIIRSHGVSPRVFEELKSFGLKIIDATCPNVSRAQKEAKSLGQTYGEVLIVGEDEHPEVIGIAEWAKLAGAKVYVCKCGDDVPDRLGQHEIGVVVQTTQNKKNLDSVLHALEKINCKFHLSNTICHATSERQEAARQLSSQVDVMIVLGGRNSANTARLFEICQENCKNVFLIQNLEELDSIDFSTFLPKDNDILKIGITAGASTPVSQIEACYEKLISFSI